MKKSWMDGRDPARPLENLPEANIPATKEAIRPMPLMHRREEQEIKMRLRNYIRGHIDNILTSGNIETLGLLDGATIRDIPNTIDQLTVKIPTRYGPEYFNIKITRSL